MTISDKIRVYELSRDLKLENKDILDAAQKLSISVRSHSSSISLEDAKKIKNLINNKNSGKKILSVTKSSFKATHQQQQNIDNQNKDNKSLTNPNTEDNSSKERLNKKPLLNKPINKSGNTLITSNKKNTTKIENSTPPSIVSNLQSQGLSNSQNKTNNSIKTKNPNDKQPPKVVQDKKSLNNISASTIKSPARPPIQLIQKPKNLTTSNK